MQPVVQPVVQLVVQRVASCIHTLRELFFSYCIEALLQLCGQLKCGYADCLLLRVTTHHSCRLLRRIINYNRLVARCGAVIAVGCRTKRILVPLTAHVNLLRDAAITARVRFVKLWQGVVPHPLSLPFSPIFSPYIFCLAVNRLFFNTAKGVGSAVSQTQFLLHFIVKICTLIHRHFMF